MAIVRPKSHHDHWEAFMTGKDKGYRSPFPIAGACLILAALMAIGCGPVPQKQAGPLLEPPKGIYFGANLDWSSTSPRIFNRRLGHRAVVYVHFFSFPLSPDDEMYMDAMIGDIEAQQGMAMLTLEPWSGLRSVTPAVAEAFAQRLRSYNRAGVPVFVRFAHEMNGSWYPWCQNPTEYIRTFTMLAKAIHEKAPQSAMVWAPSYGGGYPFRGGRYGIRPENPDFMILDTNKDGVVDMMDNPYAPYYPGDEAVDWVGMSLYHWGRLYPWGENEVPEKNKFIAQLTGTYDDPNYRRAAIPNFYEEYFSARGKPIAITETAALYNTQSGGAPEMEIKRAWWRQVFDRDTLVAYPGIKMINWFEFRKQESETGGAMIDWRVMGNDSIASAFKADLPVDLLVLDSPRKLSTLIALFIRQLGTRPGR